MHSTLSRNLVLATLVMAGTLATPALGQEPNNRWQQAVERWRSLPPEQRAQQIRQSTEQTRAALLCGISLYPDDTVAQILAASQYPQYLAKGQAHPSDGEYNTAIEALLTSNPEVLETMRQFPLATALVGLSARNDMNRTWNDILACRQGGVGALARQMATTVRATTAGDTNGASTVSAPPSAPAASSPAQVIVIEKEAPAAATASTVVYQPVVVPSTMPMNVNVSPSWDGAVAAEAIYDLADALEDSQYANAAMWEATYDLAGDINQNVFAAVDQASENAMVRYQQNQANTMEVIGEVADQTREARQGRQAMAGEVIDNTQQLAVNAQANRQDRFETGATMTQDAMDAAQDRKATAQQGAQKWRDQTAARRDRAQEDGAALATGAQNNAAARWADRATAGTERRANWKDRTATGQQNARDVALGAQGNSASRIEGREQVSSERIAAWRDKSAGAGGEKRSILEYRPKADGERAASAMANRAGIDPKQKAADLKGAFENAHRQLNADRAGRTWEPRARPAGNRAK